MIVFYIKYSPEQNINDTVSVWKEQNVELLERLKNEMKYEIMVVPAVNESSRIEKVDFKLGTPTP